MADLDFNGVVVAVGVQTSGFGVVDGDAATVAALNDTTAVDLSDFVILGDAESGDAESGVTLPNIVGVYRDAVQVAGSWTESADTFQKATVTGFDFSWVMQGNGAATSATPTPGEADLAAIIPGLEAVFETAGLTGTAGASNVEQDYNPRASTVYTTWKLWHGDLAFVFNDCVVETLTFEATPGGNVIATAAVRVGTFDHTTAIDGFTLPTPDYEELSSLAGPTVEGVAFATFGQTRGFENLTVTITNEIEEFLDSNVATTGTKLLQTAREITVNGRLYVDSGQSDAAFTELKNTSAPINDLSFQVGTAATAENDVINAFKIEVFNLQAKDIKYDRTGDKLVVELNDSKATSTTAGTEFQLTMN